MKVLNEKDYAYMGRSHGWHVFISKKKNFDPELLYVMRARMIMQDGSYKFFDPISRDEDANEEQDSLILKGNTRDRVPYCMLISVDFDEDRTSCVRKSDMKCRV